MHILAEYMLMFIKSLQKNKKLKNSMIKLNFLNHTFQIIILKVKLKNLFNFTYANEFPYINKRNLKKF